MRVFAGLGVLLVALCVTATVSAQNGSVEPYQSPLAVPPLFPPAPGELVVWRRSKAVGKPWRGRLVRGVKLPSYGADWFTFDWGTRSVPNRIWRRYGHERLVRMLLRVVGEFRLAHPEAPRVGIADLSPPGAAASAAATAASATPPTRTGWTWMCSIRGSIVRSTGRTAPGRWTACWPRTW